MYAMLHAIHTSIYISEMKNIRDSPDHLKTFEIEKTQIPTLISSERKAK